MSRFHFLYKYAKPGRILDVGNLAGGILAGIHQSLIEKHPNSEIHGLDLEDQKKYNLNFENQKVGNAETMPYEDNYFDTVYLGEVLEHSWIPKKIIDECYRILKPDGILIMDTPNVYSFSRMLRYLIKGADVILGSPDHKIFYSRAMLENLFAKSDFKIIEISTDRKCGIKGRKLKLPNFGPFKFMGEHLVGVAKK